MWGDGEGAGGMSTADQDAWAEIAAAARVVLGKQVALIPAMNPAEARDLIEAMRAALLFEQDCKVFDRDVELREQRLVYGD